MHCVFEFVRDFLSCTDLLPQIVVQFLDALLTDLYVAVRALGVFL